MYYVEINSIGGDLFLTITRGKQVLAEKVVETVREKSEILGRWACYHRCGYSSFESAYDDFKYYCTGSFNEKNIFDDTFEKEKEKDFTF